MSKKVDSEIQKEMFEIVSGLAELGEATEDFMNECFLCAYQPAEGRRIVARSDNRYAPPYAPRKQKVVNIPDDAYPHEGHEDCLIYKAMKLKEKL